MSFVICDLIRYLSFVQASLASKMSSTTKNKKSRQVESIALKVGKAKKKYFTCNLDTLERVTLNSKKLWMNVER